MFAQLIDKIAELKRPETISHNDRIFMLNGYSPVKEPVSESIKIHTLTGIMDYLRGEIDKPLDQTMFIHIPTYSEVILSTEQFGNWKQRERKVESEMFQYEGVRGWIGIEEFIIVLNSLFVPTDDSLYLLKIVSGISDNASHQITDNGISQTATVKAGISLMDNVEIKNPVTLKPYRTFPEIDQPDIQFVFRIRKSNGIQCALFEADGGKWKIETIQKIKAWFQSQIVHEIEAGHDQFKTIKIIA
jgi:hypothetical protein